MAIKKREKERKLNPISLGFFHGLFNPGFKNSEKKEILATQVPLSHHPGLFLLWVYCWFSENKFGSGEVFASETTQPNHRMSRPKPTSGYSNPILKQRIYVVWSAAVPSSQVWPELGEVPWFLVR